jgi:mannose-6-phosphate isomerase-like protein (cupin superfamily)
MKLNQTKDFDSRQAHSVVYRVVKVNRTAYFAREMKLKILPLLLLFSTSVLGEDWKVDPTWLHRYVPALSAHAEQLSPACRYLPIFGDGDADGRSLRSVSRFEEVSVDAHGICGSVTYEREEEIYFILEGMGDLGYGDKTYPMRSNDFTYVPPGMEHSIRNSSGRQLKVLVMGFKIPEKISIGQSLPTPEIVNLDDVKEENVEGHPTSVLYKLLLGPRNGKRDAIDDAYVVVSFFWMDFAPGGTNFPHHHETAEEIYLVLDGQGEMVAGGGVDGVEGRHPAKAGDAYFFRQNCTVGFYNQNKAGAKAHILAVRSKVPLPADDD